MTTTFIFLSAFFTIISALPYLIDVIRGTTKPRIVSWLNWTLLTLIATAAALSDHKYPSAVLTGAATLETLAITFFGYRNGDRHWERFDIICEIGALTGFGAWLIFNSPVIAIISSVVIDAIAGLPTWKHAWQRPFEETRNTFVLAAFGGLFSLLAIKSVSVSGMTYPVFILFANVGIVTVLTLSPNKK